MVESGGDFKLKHTDQLFAALIATAADGIIVIDTLGTVLIYNQACEKLFGYNAGEVLGKNVKMLMPASYDREHDDYLANYRRTKKKRVIGIGREVVGRCKDGTTFPIYLSVGEAQLEGKDYFVGILRDLSELRREMARRADVDRLLAQVVHSSNDAVITKTLAGVITSWNEAATRIFGYSASEAIGRHIFLIFPPDRFEEEEEIMGKLRAGEEVTHFETVRRHKDGRDVHISLSVAVIRDHQGRIVGASKTARDITQHKIAEAKEEALQNELAHAGRLSAMGQMSAAIAHELNQPLTAVTNYVKAAQRFLGDSAQPRIQDARAAMEKAAEQTIRAGTIIRYLRDFVEKRESERTKEDINDAIREAITLGLAGTRHSDIAIRLALQPDIPPLRIDKIQIQQVLLNLIRNATEAMAKTEKPEIRISSSLRDGQVAILVRDNGPGLPSAIQLRLFQAFTTTKEDGLGIGLKICQSILQAHGGSIDALNEERGAAFQIRLPLP